MQLEEYLKTNSSEYFFLYENIKQAAKDIWQEARLGWYTDHGAGHSNRIVDLLDQMCGDLLADSQPFGLRPDEVFLLLSAAWLHDIGMQDLSDLNKKSVDQQTEEEWEEVRKRHPQRSYEIISSYASGSSEKNPFDLGLNTNKDIYIPLSLICKGHGSAYYEKVATKLKNRKFNIEGRGDPVRGALLTSLLLLADELDLHGSRAVWKKNYPLSDVSKLHYFRHYFINHVEVVKLNAVDKQIQITLALPEDPLNNNWAEDLQSWLERKLKFELNRTEEHIQTGFDGHLKWGANNEPAVVFIKEPAEPNEKKLPPKEVINLLKHEITHVLDWKEATKTIKDRFTSRIGGIVLIKGGEKQGNEQFFTHLSLLLDCHKDKKMPRQKIKNIGFRSGSICGTLNQIIFYLYDKLFGEVLTTEPYEAIDALLETIKAEDVFCTVFLRDYDFASPKEWKKLVVVLEKSAIRERFLFVINTGEQLDNAKSFELPDEFCKEDMIRYFEKLGHYGVKAKEKVAMLRDMKQLHGFNAEQVLVTAASMSMSRL